MIGVDPPSVHLLEARAVLESSHISRKHGALQSSLIAATSLTKLVDPCRAVGAEIMAATQDEVANVLWDQGEMAASIRVLQDLNDSADLRAQTLRVGKSELLAKLVSLSTRLLEQA